MTEEQKLDIWLAQVRKASANYPDKKEKQRMKEAIAFDITRSWCPSNRMQTFERLGYLYDHDEAR